MGKIQRGNRETRKPKAEKPKPVAATSIFARPPGAGAGKSGGGPKKGR